MDEWLKRLSLSPVNWLILLSNIGLILIGAGVFFYKSDFLEPSTKVEILDTNLSEGEITVEIAGEIVSPGVYKLPGGSRVEDLLITAGGFSAGADRDGVEKHLNRAAKLFDGQKVYVASQSEVSSAKNSDYIKESQPVLGVNQSGLTNINTASLSEPDKLPGIGPVYGQSIIDHRPYSNVEELLSKEALKKSVYEKIKNVVSVY